MNTKLIAATVLAIIRLTVGEGSRGGGGGGLLLRIFSNNNCSHQSAATTAPSLSAMEDYLRTWRRALSSLGTAALEQSQVTKTSFQVQAQVSYTDQSFTLIELFTAIAILGILAAVTIPSFITYADKSVGNEIMPAESSGSSTTVVYKLQLSIQSTNGSQETQVDLKAFQNELLDLLQEYFFPTKQPNSRPMDVLRRHGMSIAAAI